MDGRDMSQVVSQVALITPTYSHDLERCALLCESVDRYVIGFANHYLIVPDDELTMFARFHRGRRQVLPLSQLLPSWLKLLPRFVRRNNRQYWWSMHGKPVNGWHVQQYVKIAMAYIAPETVSCMLDSDVAFFRPFNLSNLAPPNPTPLFIAPGDVTDRLPNHVCWLRTSHRLLGLGPPAIPADDYIGHIIFWNQQAVRAMTARIERVSGLEWIDALYRAHAISEYMLYGYFVSNDAQALRNHCRTTQSPCFSYWDSEPLDQAALERTLCATPDHCVAFSSASINGTSVQDVRAALAQLTNSKRALLPGGSAPPMAPAEAAERQVIT
jgi:Family of unknown function (DUF6492)